MKILGLLLLFSVEMYSQKSDTTQFSSFVNITFGAKKISKNSFNPTSQSDYFDYLNDYDNQQLGLQIRKKFKNKQSITVSLSTYSDLVPRNIDVFYAKLFKKEIGFFTGFKTFGYYFIDYQKILSKESDGSFNETFGQSNHSASNQKYGYVNQGSIYLGPMFYLKKKRFTIESKLNFGLSYLGGFSDASSFSSINTFERKIVKVKSLRSPYFSFTPDISLSYFPVVFKKSKIGITAYGNYQKVNRSFNYQKTTNKWSIDSFEKVNIKGPVNQFENFEFNFGLVWQN